MTKRTMLEVEGMTCGHCVKHVTTALSKVPGVVHAEVRLQPGEADVSCEEQVSVEALVAAIAAEGYSARPRTGAV